MLIVYADATADILAIPRVSELPQVLAYISSLGAIERVYPQIPDWLSGIPIPSGVTPCYISLPYGDVFCHPEDAVSIARSLLIRLIKSLRTESGSLDVNRVLATPDLVRGLFFGGKLLEWIAAEARTGKEDSDPKPAPHLRALQWLSLLNACNGSPEGAILLMQNMSQGEMNWLLLEMSQTPEMRQLRDFERRMPKDLSGIQAKSLEFLSTPMLSG